MVSLHRTTATGRNSDRPLRRVRPTLHATQYARGDFGARRALPVSCAVVTIIGGVHMIDGGFGIVD